MTAFAWAGRGFVPVHDERLVVDLLFGVAHLLDVEPGGLQRIGGSDAAPAISVPFCTSTVKLEGSAG